MLDNSIVAQRRVCDYLNGSRSSTHNFRIEDDLRSNCINTYSNHKEYNSEKKTVDQSEEDEKLSPCLPILKLSKDKKWNSLRLLLC